MMFATFGRNIGVIRNSKEKLIAAQAKAEAQLVEYLRVKAILDSFSPPDLSNVPEAEQEEKIRKYEEAGKRLLESVLNAREKLLELSVQLTEKISKNPYFDIKIPETLFKVQNALGQAFEPTPPVEVRFARKVEKSYDLSEVTFDTITKKVSNFTISPEKQQRLKEKAKAFGKKAGVAITATNNAIKGQPLETILAKYSDKETFMEKYQSIRKSIHPGSTFLSLFKNHKDNKKRTDLIDKIVLNLETIKNDENLKQNPAELKAVVLGCLLSHQDELAKSYKYMQHEMSSSLNYLLNDLVNAVAVAPAVAAPKDSSKPSQEKRQARDNAADKIAYSDWQKTHPELSDPLKRKDSMRQEF